MNRNIMSKLVVALFVFLLCSGCGRGKQADEEVAPRPIKIYDISLSGVTKTLEFSGIISPMQTVDMAFEVPGKLIEFPVLEGQVVQKGQMLAKLDNRDYKNLFDSKKAVFTTAKKDYERSEALLKEQVISRRDYDNARRNFDVADADLKAARKQLDDAMLIAPFTGRVAKKLMDNFQNVQAKQAVLIFQDDSMLKFVVSVPEKDFAGGRPDMDLATLTERLKPQVSLSSVPDRFFPAIFDEVATTADPVTRTFEITLKFQPPSDMNILPGMTARLSVSIPAEKLGSNETRIPANAVFSDGDGVSSVWIINPDTMTVESRQVETGAMKEASIIIKSGLSDGDMVALSGVHQLRKGTKVTRYEK